MKYTKEELTMVENCLDNKYTILEHIRTFKQNKVNMDEFKVLTKKGENATIVVDWDGEIISKNGILIQRR